MYVYTRLAYTVIVVFMDIWIGGSMTRYEKQALLYLICISGLLTILITAVLLLFKEMP